MSQAVRHEIFKRPGIPLHSTNTTKEKNKTSQILLLMLLLLLLLLELFAFFELLLSRRRPRVPPGLSEGLFGHIDSSRRHSTLP